MEQLEVNGHTLVVAVTMERHGRGLSASLERVVLLKEKPTTLPPFSRPQTFIEHLLYAKGGCRNWEYRNE